MAVELNYYESEFLARWIDATLRELVHIQQRPVDYMTAQAFLGKDIPADMEGSEMLEEVSDLANGLQLIRERIKEGFGI